MVNAPALATSRRTRLIPCSTCSEPVAMASQHERDDHEGVPLCESCGSHFHPTETPCLHKYAGARLARQPRRR